jgi:hypothetical protein
LQDWETLLREVRSQEAELAALVTLREELEQAYTRAQSTRGMRETLNASSRDSTRRLRAVLTEGQQAAVRLRHLVKSLRRSC